MAKQQAEAERLWQEIKKVEAWPAKTEAEFKSKKKELEKLRAAYEKVVKLPTGAGAEKANRLRSRGMAENMIVGGRPRHETSDSVEDFRKRR